MKRRIIVCLGIILALCLLGDVIAMLCLGRSIGRISAIAESRRIQAMRTNLVSSAVRIETDLLAHRAGHAHPPEEREDHLRRLQDSVQRCTGCHHVPAIYSRLVALQNRVADYRSASVELFRRPAPANAEALEDRVQDLVDDIVRRATAMADLADRHLVMRNSNAAASVRQAWVVLSTTMIAALIAGGIVAFHLKKRLTAPVEVLMEGIEKTRQGDLTHRIAVDGDEEFQTLASAFNRACSNLKHAQDGVLHAEKMAAVGKLAAGVAHEVGNPLASISSIAQIMRRESSSPELNRQLDLILEQVGRISRILQDLLIFSRPSVEKRREIVDVAALLRRATALLGYDRRARSIDVTLDVEESLAPVLGDPDRLLLVFTNIMINAFDAIVGGSPDAKGSLTISGRQNGDDLVLRFQDDGPGMSEELIANAFEPFFTTKSPGHGTGLGLWICYQTIDKHGGRIDIESRAGEGTTVILRLPVTRGPAEERAAARVRQPGGSIRDFAAR